MQHFYKQSCALQLQIILAPQGGATTGLINQATAMLLFYIINIKKSIKFLSLFLRLKNYFESFFFKISFTSFGFAFPEDFFII